MCGRYTLTKSKKALIDHFQVSEWIEGEVGARYNIAPTQPVLVVRLLRGRRRLDHVRWGLVPSWAKDPTIGGRMINARAETIVEKPAYRAAFRYRRCLIPADGFYEWRKLVEGGKQPFYIHLRDGGVFAFAGLWEHWQGEDGSELESCTIITTTSNERLSDLHDRMPVILGPDHYDVWLRTDSQDAPGLLKMLQPYTAAPLDAYPVSQLVNSARNDGPACVRRLE